MAKKILRCNFKDHWNHFPIIDLKIEDIWQSVPSVDFLPYDNRPFKKNLINDIRKDGMRFPVMVVKTSHKELIEAKEKWEDKINTLPFWHNDRNPQSKYQWSVWGGSQRVDVARTLKYTHIASVVLPSIAKAVSLQKFMRKPYIKRYYEK
tara:strand:- start:26 stop:475 length:450 start_codon:yes stop_codon:yes gene_type:complete